MSGKTGIQWTDASWNPTVGCKRVSAGCDHCYAFQLHDQRHIAWKRGRWDAAPAQYHQPFSRVQLLPERLTDPYHWRKPRRVFVNSMSDLFHEDVPNGFIFDVFAAMHDNPQHTFQILTKRPQRMRDFCKEIAYNVPGYANLPNVWLGVSVENQQAADERIPLLLQTPAAVRFLSCEPLLGPVNLYRHLFHQCADGCECRWPGDPDARDCACGGECQTADEWGMDPGIHWVIIGGESGKHARRMNPEWACSLVEQCREAGVAPFVKQLGSELAYLFSLKDRHGGTMEEWPPDYPELRVREFPPVREAVRA